MAVLYNVHTAGTTDDFVLLEKRMSKRGGSSDNAHYANAAMYLRPLIQTPPSRKRRAMLVDRLIAIAKMETAGVEGSARSSDQNDLDEADIREG